jgi:hypothetical protein
VKVPEGCARTLCTRAMMAPPPPPDRRTASASLSRLLVKGGIPHPVDGLSDRERLCWAADLPSPGAWIAREPYAAIAEPRLSADPIGNKGTDPTCNCRWKRAVAVQENAVSDRMLSRVGVLHARGRARRRRRRRAGGGRGSARANRWSAGMMCRRESATTVRQAITRTGAAEPKISPPGGDTWFRHGSAAAEPELPA